MVARVYLDLLRSRNSRREEPLGASVPEPGIGHRDGIDPEQEALLADSVGLALLVVLDTLTPAERLAFVLHDLFAVPRELSDAGSGEGCRRRPDSKPTVT